MVWLIIVEMLVLVVVAALLRDSEPAFPTKARRRTGKRGRLSVVEAVDDSAPSVFAGAWHGADCGTTSDAGSSDSCADSSSSSD